MPKTPDSESPVAARDALSDYRSKRDPKATNEPFSAAVAPKIESTVGDFVVHLHAATRRHYDLRLQIGATLRSFAVPRGPSQDPKDRRLAVQTEDHPMEYLDFEDVIPAGNYGAGPMIVWDIGRVRFLEQPAEQGLAAGKLDFLLFGRKLQGRFALVETTARVKPRPKQRQWLLLKKADAHSSEPGEKLIVEQPESVLSGLQVEQLVSRPALAGALLARAAALGAKKQVMKPLGLTPMLCVSEGASLSDPERLYELKLDGVRIWAVRNGSEVRLRYRTQRSALDSYPEIARALSCAYADDFVVDGEIVSFDEEGKPNFQRLAPRIHAFRPRDVKRVAAEVPVVYLVFDLIKLGPYDLTGLPLEARKELLKKLFPGRGLVRYLDHITADGAQLFQLCEAQGMEGVVSKRKSGTYQFGPKRSGDWVKHKCERDDDFVVVGWVAKKGTEDQIGALELATYQGPELVYRGRVGTGFNDEALALLQQRMNGLESNDWLAEGEPLKIEASKRRFFLKPKLVVSVRYLEWTSEGRLRMASFRGLRADQHSTQCLAAPAEARLQGALDQGAEVSVVAADRLPAVRRGARVQLSNLDKVFWPEEGYTKGDLLNYYELVAPALLPHLLDRPVMLVRYPDGITGKSFYQWNTPTGTPDWIQTLKLRDEERDGKEVTTFLIDDVDSLLHIVNLGCIPIHVLACQKQSRECCDFLTIDFDIGEQPFRDAILLALSLKDLLGELGLRGFPKTSGQSGLHVMIPLGPGVPFPVAKVMVELLGRLLQLRHPEISTMERRVSGRGQRVYIDTGQTGRSRTIVSPYSVRAYRGGSVSTPLLWEEVHLALKPQELTLFTLPARLAERGDPMAEMLSHSPDVPAAIGQLEKLINP